MSVLVKRLCAVIGCLLLSSVLAFSATAAPNQINLSYAVAPMTVDAHGVVAAEGLNLRHTTAGVPDLPYFSKIVPIPAGLEPTVLVEESDVSQQTPLTVHPVVEIVVDGNSAESLLTNGYQTRYRQDAAVYGADAPFPPQPYTVERIVLEDQPHLRLTFFPIRYNPVLQTLIHVGQIDVQIDLTPSRTTWNGTDELSICCDLPLNPKTARTQLPVGDTVLKIEVNTAGIYALTYADIVALAPAFAGKDPNSFKMLTNGDDVAFQVIGGGDNSFDSGDAIRFYGWPYDGPRVDAQYIVNNVFWLWADGNGSPIGMTTNPTGYAQQTSFRDSITFEQDLGFTDTGTNDWDLYDNEPDAWYWQRWSKSSALPALYTIPIDVPNPVATGTDATLTAEILAVGSKLHSFTIGLSGSAATGNRIYPALGSYNVSATIPAADLVNGINTVEIVDDSTNASTAYFNRVTLDYDRALLAAGDRLIFGRSAAGQSEFNIAGFTTPNAVAWDITNRHNPVAIPADVSGTGSFTYRIASDHAANAAFIATSTAGLLKPVATSAYEVTELTPPAGADWLAVTHPDFLNAVDTLAAHRAAYSSMTTHVVSVVDVINQYGYGLPTPNGIRDYVAHAVTTWPTAPRYLLLGGDASNNPRELACSFCPSYFEIDATYVPTFLPFSDRFIGQQPSDHPYALVTGGDELADIAVGRLTVETLAQADVMVDKIIQYETNLLTPQPYMQDLVFMVDDDDPDAAIYCADSEAIASSLDNSLHPDVKCLPDGSTLAKTALRTELINTINTTGTSILNYRGHGSAVDWAGGVLSRDHAPLFANIDKPFVIITADCLDGHFAWYNLDTIGETFLRRPDVASAAHWSASGLGFSFEYNVLHVEFYEGLFDAGKTAIGDAIVYAKHSYVNTGYDSVTGFSMNLQGDPAMELKRPDVSVDVTPAAEEVGVSSTLDLTLNVANAGQYPSKLRLTVPLPPQFDYLSLSSAHVHTVSENGNTVTIDLTDALGHGESAEFTLRVNVVGGSDSPVEVQLQSDGPGLEINPGDESDTATIRITAAPTAITLGQANTNAAASQLWLTIALLLALLSLAALRRQQVVQHLNAVQSSR